MTKNIIIRVDASKEIGFGHFYRCLALAKILKPRFQIVFAMSKPSNLICTSLKEEGFELISLSPISYKAPDEDIQQIEFDLPVKGECQIIIIDGYRFGPIFRQQAIDQGYHVVLVDDFGGNIGSVSAVINSSPHVTESNYMVSEGTKLLLGLNYALLRPEFRYLAKRTTKKEQKEDSFIVCVGGSDFRNLTIPIIKELLNSGVKSNINVVLGQGYGFHDELEALLVDKVDNVNLHSSLNEMEMAILMEKASIAIVPASGVLLEAICAGCQIITFWYAENQRNFHNFFEREKMVSSFGDNSKSFNRLGFRETLNRINSENDLKSMDVLRSQMADSNKNLMREFIQL